MSIRYKFNEEKNQHEHTFSREHKYIPKDLMSDLPDNAYIHKGVTGCGGSSLALENHVPYVITVPMKNLIINKEYQYGKDVVLGVTGDTTREEIREYIDNLKPNQVPKIMVTFDSLSKVTDSIDVSGFKLLIDEAQTLVQYGGTFKPEVCNAVLRKGYNFKSISYITATPTPRKYLPVEIQELDYHVFNWEGASKPSIRHAHLTHSLNDNILSIIIDRLINTKDDIYIFYNSLQGVAGAIEQILDVKSLGLTITDINLMFADSHDNNKFFKGKFSNIDLTYNPQSNKRINFLSSMAFQGIDIYTPNNVTSIIVSDAKKRSMRYDVHIDLPQIVGRFRTVKETGFTPRNDIIFLWMSYENDTMLNAIDEDDYSTTVIEEIANVEKDVIESRTSEYRKRTMDDYITKNRYPIVLCKNPEVVVEEREYYINTLAYSSLMSVYASLYEDFVTFDNIDEICEVKEDSAIVNKISQCFGDVDTFKAIPLPASIRDELGRAVSFKYNAKDFHRIMTQLSNSYDNETIRKLTIQKEDSLKINDDLRKYVEVLGWQRLSTLSFAKAKLEKEYENIYVFIKKKETILTFMNLEVGKIYSRKELINKLTSTYDNFGISLEPKVSHINKLYDNKNSTMKVDGVLEHAIKITGIK